MPACEPPSVRRAREGVVVDVAEHLVGSVAAGDEVVRVARSLPASIASASRYVTLKVPRIVLAWGSHTKV